MTKQDTMPKVALMVIYNHRFDQNIPCVEALYKGKFSHIFHIMPFYDGDRENVIPVFESSFYFEGYVAQAYQHVKHMGFTHFFFVADDMVLNPIVNEKNLWEAIGLEQDECLHSGRYGWNHLQTYGYWKWTFNALKYQVRQKGVEVEKILPSAEEARRRFDFHHIPYSKVKLSTLFGHGFKRSCYTLLQMPFSRSFKYPLVAGYSDLFLIPAEIMPKFTTYCGAFAATKLFVEVAIPTALALAADKIKFVCDTKLGYGAIWKQDDTAWLDQMNYSLSKLLDEYPKDTLFLHPIKLSKWK